MPGAGFLEECRCKQRGARSDLSRRVGSSLLQPPADRFHKQCGYEVGHKRIGETVRGLMGRIRSVWQLPTLVDQVRKRRTHLAHEPGAAVLPKQRPIQPFRNAPARSVKIGIKLLGCRPLTAPTGACLPACPPRTAGGRELSEERAHARRRSYHLDQLDRVLRLRRPLCNALGREVNGRRAGAPAMRPTRIPTLPTAPDARPRVRGLFCAHVHKTHGTCSVVEY